MTSDITNSTYLPLPPIPQLQNNGTSGFTLGAGLIFVISLVLLIGKSGNKIQVRKDGSEPTAIKSTIPFLGHLIGLLKWQVGYLQLLRIFAARIYVICEPSLIQAAYRNTKSFDFTNFVVDSSQRAFNIGKNGMKIIRGETSPDYDPKGPPLNGNDGRSYLNDNHKLMVELLGPGPSLLELNKGVLDTVANSLNDLGENEGEIELYEWMRTTLTLAVSASLYGPHDPFNADHSLADSLWDFEENMTMLMLQFLPSFLAPRAYRGRAAIKAAFTSYYAASHHLTASALVKTRLECAQSWGFSSEDISNFEISTLFLATTNTAPTSFWLLVNILQNPSLISSIRSEISNIIRNKKAPDGAEECIMDTTLFQSRCPILVAAFQETLRLVDAATSIRSITQDVLLTSPTSTSTYLLKAGNTIQLPSGVTHLSPSIWGPDVNSFNPYRFLPSTTAALSKDQKRKQTQGYFPFGGGKHLCPGKRLATTQILAFVAAIVMGCEVRGARVPERAFQKLGTAVRKPEGDVLVGVKRRRGWEGVRWKFDVGDVGSEGEGEKE
ncbi:hypothetical protein CJF32_00007747 [Rutstroemia sp. NJR-2017a WRK4]|nr:hypothetical protein CJF32_00007747 [Rutstroemia sp. NJR-2017a WRK4]